MRFLKRYWVDLVGTVIAWAYMGLSFDFWLYGYMGLFPDNEPSAILIYLSTLLAVPLWIFLRLCPLAYKLTEKQRREEIALTLIPAKKYLFSQLKGPTLMALAPCTAWFSLLLLAWQWDWPRTGMNDFDLPMAVIFLMFISIVGLVSLITSFCGVLVFLRQLSQNRSSTKIVLLTFSYGISLFLTLIAALFTGIYPLVAALMIPALIWFAHGRWERAYALYYEFD